MVDMKDLYYVDYCNNCKDLDIMDSCNEVPCHHPWYCWHDGGEVEDLENKIQSINHNVKLRGYICAYEYEELKKLRKRKFELVKQKLRGFRRLKK